MQDVPPSQSIVYPLIEYLTRPSHFLTRHQLLLRLSGLPGGASNWATSRRTPTG
jgi:hypothetical protein